MQAFVFAAVVFLLSVLGLTGLVFQQNATARASEQLAQAQKQWALSQAFKHGADAKASENAMPALPAASELDVLLQDITAQARRQQLQLSQMGVSTRQATAQDLAQKWVSVQAQGRYADIKKWMSALLQAHPWLGLQSLSWRAPAVHSSSGPMNGGTVKALEMAQEASIVWVLYVQN